MDINLATFRVIGLLLKLFLFPLWQLLIYLFGYAINLLPLANDGDLEREMNAIFVYIFGGSSFKPSS